MANIVITLSIIKNKRRYFFLKTIQNQNLEIERPYGESQGIDFYSLQTLIRFSVFLAIWEAALFSLGSGKAAL